MRVTLQLKQIIAELFNYIPTWIGRIFNRLATYHSTILRRKNKAISRFQCVLLFFLCSLLVNGSSASPSRVFKIAYLEADAEVTGKRVLSALKAELVKAGWVEGINVNFVARYAAHDLLRLSTLATELVNERPTIIVAPSQAAAAAARAATATIPIVFSTSSDPVIEGLVPDLAKPGGNMTGFYQFLDLDAKLCQIAFDAFPTAKKIAFLYDETEKNLPNVTSIRALEKAFHKEVSLVAIRNVTHFRLLAKHFRSQQIDVVVVPMMYAFFKAPELFIAELNGLRLPTVFERAAYASLGGLISYGPMPDEPRKAVARMVAKILAGASPATMPIERPQKIELTLNTETAQLLGVKLDRSFLIRVNRYFPEPQR